MVMRTHIPRRGFLKIGSAAMVAAAAAPRAAAAAMQAPPAQWKPLMERARAALELHSDRISERDRFAVVDFSLPSSAPRMLLVDQERGLHQLMRVAHGRGSDPAHSGWVKAFSNAPGSYASSRGVYVTGQTYVGKHGHSRRLTGLDGTNDNAEARAIVIHGAWYCNDDILRGTGKLGRSEGCFAVSESEIESLLDWLGPNRLLYADKL